MFFLIINNDQTVNSSQDQRIEILVDEVKNGNSESFDELVFQFRDQVYFTAWHLTRNTEDAMDVTQEAFIRVYKALDSYKGRSKFATWLHRIVLNTGIDYLRRESRHRHISTDNEDLKPETWEPSHEAGQRDVVYQAELHKHVMTALEQLSSRQRQVFLLRYYHDLDIRETARVLKCTEGSIKRHLFRAQARLKILLSEIKRGKP